MTTNFEIPDQIYRTIGTLLKMARRLETGGRDGPYRRRKITVEPVFGQIKQARRFR